VGCQPNAGHPASPEDSACNYEDVAVNALGQGSLGILSLASLIPDSRMYSMTAIATLPRVRLVLDSSIRLDPVLIPVSCE